MRFHSLARRFDDFQQDLAIAPTFCRAGFDASWLTERGLDLYQLPLSMLTWGQRWLEPNESDIDLTHTVCGNDLKPVLSCDRCAAPIAREDIRLS
jgi:hypothetical protein